MSVIANQNLSMNRVKETETNGGECFSLGRVAPVVIVLLQREIGGESGLKKLIE